MLPGRANRWQRANLASRLWHSLLLNASQVTLDVLVLLESMLELILVQLRLEAEDFFSDLLVLSLDSFKLCLTSVKVETAGLELNDLDGVALVETALD